MISTGGIRACVDRHGGQGDVHDSMPEICGATRRHTDACVIGTQACQTHAASGVSWGTKPDLTGMVMHGEAQGCGKHGCKWVGVHELPSPAQGQSGCRDRGPDSGPAVPEPEKEERTP